MKIQVKRNFSVVLYILVQKVLWALVIFIFFLIIGVLLTNNSFIGLGLPLFVIFIYLVYYAIDSYVYAKSAKVEMKENMISLSSRNILSKTNHTYPVAQVNSVIVTQPFTLKIFGISDIAVSIENGQISSLWGFNYEDVESFISEFNNKYHIKIKRSLEPY